jgi:hypothetical protein
MPAITEKPMLSPEQWLETRAMEIFNDTLQYIDIAALYVALVSSI